MAFVPMTPPPMMPDDDMEDLDEIEDFGQIEDEDEDSSSYDLTGMSEKLQSIPKETIQVAPKEVVLPPVTSGPDQNGFLTELRGEQIPPDGKSDHENEEIHIPNSEIISEKPPKIEIDSNFLPEIPVETTNDVNKLPNLSSQPPEMLESPEMGSTEILKSNSDQDSDFGDFESEKIPDFSDFKSEKYPVVSCQDNNDSGVPGSLQDKEVVKIETETAFDDVIQDKPKTEMETTMQDETEDHEIESKSIQDESLENEPKEEESIQIPDEHSFNSDNEEDKSEVPPLQDQPVDEDFDVDFDDDFGDFEEAFEQGNDNAGSGVQEQEPITFVPPLNLDEDMEDDDDFGDFEEPEAFTEHQTSDKFEAFASSSGWASLDSSPRGQIDQILIGLQLKLATVISNLYVRSLESPESDASLDRVQSLDFAKAEDCEDPVWIQIHSVSNTPALNQKWKETVTRHRLLDFLKVDPNNVIHQDGGMGRRGGRNTSSRPLPQASAYNVPAFASGLGMTLEPIKAAAAATSAASFTATPAVGNGGGPAAAPAAAAAPNATVTLEKDNTEEAIAMSTTKASRREDNDNHAAVANIKGSSTKNPMPAVSKSDNKEISVNNSLGPSLLPNGEDYRGKSTKTASKHGTRSQRAQTVLDSFPLLDFMQSSVLSGSLQAASANL